MSTTISKEKRPELLKQVDALKTNEKITVAEACKKIGISVNNYYVWSRKINGRKYKKRTTKSRRPQRRTRKQPIVVTALVKADQFGNEQRERLDFGNTKPDVYQVAELLAHMNANSLRSLFSERNDQ